MRTTQLLNLTIPLTLPPLVHSRSSPHHAQGCSCCRWHRWHPNAAAPRQCPSAHRYQRCSPYKTQTILHTAPSCCLPHSRFHLRGFPRLRRHHCSAAAALQAAIVPPRCCYLLAAAIALATVPSNRCSGSCLDILGHWWIVVDIPWYGGLTELLGERK